MNWILALAGLTCLVAFAWSVLLLRELRDWRIGSLTALLAVMCLRVGQLLLTRPEVSPLDDLPVLLGSGLAVLAVVCLGRLIRDRYRFAHDLRHSEEKYRSLIETTGTGYLILDERGRVLDANAEYVRLAGHDRLDEVRGRFVTEWTAAHDRERNIHEVYRCLARGAVRRLEIDYVDREGRLRPIEINATVIATDEGPRIIGLCRDITDRKRAEEELRRQAERLTVLSRRVVEAHEEERRHLARELHDEIGQVLTSINLGLLAVKAEAPAAAGRLDECLQVLEGAIEQVRGLSLDLRPAMLDVLGLGSALRWCVERQAQRAGFTGEVVCRLERTRLPGELEITCFRVVQEALTNAARHAGAGRVRVELRQDEAEVRLLVEDDGVGFDVAAARERAGRGGSFGVLGMQERVELAGGQFDIRSGAGEGTSIRVRFLLRSPAGAGEAEDAGHEADSSLAG